MDIVSFFAGCGGLDLGFERAGFRVIWANDFEPSCYATYTRNHPHTKFILDDICKINPTTIPQCDGFIGGPPCQSWSIGGKQQGINDKRGRLFQKYIELIEIKKPAFFVIENVKGILDNKFTSAFEYFIHSLESADYSVKWALLDAINYRVPQNRERVFIVGFRKKLNILFKFPTPTSSKPITLLNAIGDITDTPNFYYDKINNHSYYKNSGESLTPNHDVLSSKFGSFYYRGNRLRSWQQPSFTINATADFTPLHPSSPKMIYSGHENWHFQKDKLNLYRRLSVRECARIQTFPDNFIFDYDNIRDAYKMIGNAVPPRLGYVIAKSILCSLNTLTLVGYYKDTPHKQLILANKIYYIRSDHRLGSLSKDDCSITPKYLLLHHKNEAEIYSLDKDKPIVVNAPFLNKLGFKTSGNKYLCFKLKSTTPEPIASTANLHQYTATYLPYFTTFEKQHIFKHEQR